MLERSRLLLSGKAFCPSTGPSGAYYPVIISFMHTQTMTKHALSLPVVLIVASVMMLQNPVKPLPMPDYSRTKAIPYVWLRGITKLKMSIRFFIF